MDYEKSLSSLRELAFRHNLKTYQAEIRAKRTSAPAETLSPDVIGLRRRIGPTPNAYTKRILSKAGFTF